ncbi:cobalamin (vitamin B12) biosynthesis protein CobD/CbiB [Gluconobacter thailandicus F149-1 = NBRC 100600]|uniref:Cobalamin biosynthesis protein CobD n=1 Tax=Gluconobacter thailandicus NBRC 3257 TaxID=1381097 RepID=A0ABQ0IZS0_GLUTH|nr:cobalamin(vitamin B12) biosynthesis protein CobD/CbiB [Gluconobacter thailandicus NBRC 3257]GAN93172.1 cobalamin (vitamin B12) biosynthesis protein CobD/CbiB [Gluconobacter thailandicus F149-1 = NBRC 100600]GBR58528.1 cobalamin biosynthesis protein CobD/CbiB [Gluconobacter thailandicus F149-1 = NBRC 100600]GEL86929.1 cobalamin biosynthesis protein CobD [Gluconobacter thailandicus F149-1 = NBRC 100600]
MTWVGALIARLDRTLNHPKDTSGLRKFYGVIALGVLTLIPVIVVVLCLELLRLIFTPLQTHILEGLAASTLIAQRSLWEHVRAVLDGFEPNGLSGGRKAVSMIVGRDPEQLDEAGVVRAAIESLAENFSDGIVAPLFWTALGGLPGVTAYKSINTADSMIGHLTPRHAAFGWASAKLDDLVNLPASRLSALWIILGAMTMRGASPSGAFRAVRRDARHHRSPNAGWPEAAMAGALGLKLAGPRVYGGVTVEDYWMGNGRSEATQDDLARALRLYRRACIIQGLVLVGLTLMVCF